MKKIFVKCIAVCCCVLMFVGLLGCQNQEPYEPTQEDLVTWETEGKQFGNYSRPVAPLTLLEEEPGLVASRALTVDVHDTDPTWGLYSSVEDTYDITNTTNEDITTTLLYPFYGEHLYWDSIDNYVPTVTVNQTPVDKIAFTDALIEHDGFGFINFKEYQEAIDAVDVIGTGEDWTLLDATPVTIYQISYGTLEDANVSLGEDESMSEVRIYYDNHGHRGTMLTDATGYFVDETGSYISVNYNHNPNRVVTLVCISGEWDDFSAKTSIMKTVGAKDASYQVDLGVTIKETTSTLGQFVRDYDHVFDDWVNIYEEAYEESSFVHALKFELEGYADPDARGVFVHVATFDELIQDTLDGNRICYMYHETTIPAGETITVVATQNLAASTNWPEEQKRVSEPESWHGFEVATQVGTNLKFDAMSMDVSWDDQILILADNIITDENQKLDLDKELYYIYYLTESDIKRSFRLRPIREPAAAAKPVLYLYPEETTDVTVKLNVDGALTSTWPKCDEYTGWQVTAQPDGTIIDKEGYEYSYLFWEASLDQEWDFSKGFVVAGEDSAEFLREKLAYMGLTPREYNEFIVYWAPILEENAYNLITFQWEEYEQAAALTITPTPDNMLRVYMAYQPLSAPMDVPEQELPILEREGFTVVEWGGNRLE